MDRAVGIHRRVPHWREAGSRDVQPIRGFPVFCRRPGPSRHHGERALEAEAAEWLMAKSKTGKKKSKKKAVPISKGKKKKGASR